MFFALLVILTNITSNSICFSKTEISLFLWSKCRRTMFCAHVSCFSIFGENVVCGLKIRVKSVSHINTQKRVKNVWIWHRPYGVLLRPHLFNISIGMCRLCIEKSLSNFRFSSTVSQTSAIEKLRLLFCHYYQMVALTVCCFTFFQ